MAVILVVDDEKPLRDLIRRVLEGLGHSVIEAPDGKTGLALFWNNLPALVICDIIMPQQNGVEMVVRLRTENTTVPIIAISGGGRARILDLLEVAKEAGVNTVLPKPFRKEELVMAVDHFIRRPSGN